MQRSCCSRHKATAGFVWLKLGSSGLTSSSMCQTPRYPGSPRCLLSGVAVTPPPRSGSRGPHPGTPRDKIVVPTTRLLSPLPDRQPMAPDLHTVLLLNHARSLYHFASVRVEEKSAEHRTAIRRTHIILEGHCREGFYHRYKSIKMILGEEPATVRHRAAYICSATTSY